MGEAENESGNDVIGWASAAINVGNIVLRAAGTLGRKLSPPLMSAGSHFSNAASVAGVAYDIYRENGLKHQGERAAAGVSTTTLSIVLGASAATGAETAALAGVAGATGATVVTAAAPVVLSAVAAGAVAKVADLSIENRRGYEDFDRDTARDSAPVHVRTRPEYEKPSLLDYKHLASMRGVTAHMRDKELHTAAKIERFYGSGNISNLGAIDLTDAANLEEYERALNLEIAKQKAIVDANDSFLPRWARYGESINRYNFADGELQNLLGARQELAMLREDVKRYEEQKAGGVAPKYSEERPAALEAKHMVTPSFNSCASGVGSIAPPSRAPEPPAAAPARSQPSPAPPRAFPAK